MPSHHLWARAAVLGTTVAVAARRRRALSRGGAIGAACVGMAIYGAAGIRGASLLLMFFGSSTVLSRLARSSSGERIAPERTLVQVLANGGVPALAALLGVRRTSPRIQTALAGALAAANADTWATEIGRLSPSPPRMITSGQIAPRGVSGAITPLGTLASVGGALCIATLHGVQVRRAGSAARVTIAGCVGATADSALGATLQAVYICRECGERTEDRTHGHSGRRTLTRLRGMRFMTNDTVNLCASVVGAIVAAFLHI